MPLNDAELLRLERLARRRAEEPVRERMRRLRALERWILSNTPEIRHALHADLGKPAAEAELTEAYGVLSEIRHALAGLPRWMSEQPVPTPLAMVGTRAWTRQEPKGVCLIIGPWNFPFLLMAGPLVSALAAGNTAVLKPSEHAPATARLIARMVSELFPDHSIHVCEGGKEVAESLTRLPFNHIFFTGSQAVGKHIRLAATELGCSVTLELGGQCPAVVLADADLEDAARKIAAAKFFNCGQTCIAPDHVRVEASVFDRFLELLRELATRLFGDPALSEQSPDYGSIIHTAHAERLSSLLNDALASGAVLRHGGMARPDQRFIAPTILTGTNRRMRIRKEEIFGPILPVEPFETVDALLAEYEQAPVPLAAYTFTRKEHRFRRISAGLRSGAMLWNECALHFLHPGLPFGGIQSSGLGRAHGHAGFLGFSDTRSYLRQRTGWTGIRIFYPPYTRWTRRLGNFLLRWL